MKRTCSNCCAYEDGECMNLGRTSPGDVCDQHRTVEEDRREDDAIARFRAAIGLPPRKPLR